MQDDPHTFLRRFFLPEILLLESSQEEETVVETHRHAQPERHARTEPREALDIREGFPEEEEGEEGGAGQDADVQEERLQSAEPGRVEEESERKHGRVHDQEMTLTLSRSVLGEDLWTRGCHGVVRCSRSW